MSYLAIDQLQNNTPVTQKIRLKRGTNLEAIRLNLCKQGLLVDGTLTVEVYDGLNILGSMSLSYLEINTVGLNFHGMVRFIPASSIAIRKSPTQSYIELTFKVTFSNHTDSDNAFVGLIKEPHSPVDQYNLTNNPNYPTVNDSLDVWYRPFGIELYSN